MRVRISTDALRLATLVVAGVASGYLWRAAFEPTAVRPAARAPSVVAEALAPEPPVRITVTTAVPKAGKEERTRAVRARRSATISRRPLSTPAARGAGPARPVPPPRAPSPNPTPPTAPPPPSGSGPGAGPTSTPPPAPAPVEPAPSTGAGPAPAQASAPPSAPPPAASPSAAAPAANAPEESRPGWGYGDKNHGHAGPPGSDGPDQKHDG